MAGSVNMEVNGMDALMGRILEVRNSVSPKVMARILGEAAQPILLAAQANVNIRTMKLHGKIRKTKPRTTGDRASITIGVPRGEGVAYAVPLEWGHVNRDGSITQPYPFMQTAYEEWKGDAYQIIREEVGKVVFGGGNGK